MTEDIVARLRRGGGCPYACRVQDAASGCECAEAADEIERLRGRLAEVEGAQMLPRAGRRAEGGAVDV